MNREEKLPKDPTSSRIESIQVLRALAAMVVAVYHSRDLIGEEDPFKAEIDFFFDSGPAGVPLFFVISGFIMVYITRDTSATRVSVYRFVVNRLLRVWPTYAVVTVLFYFIHHGLSTDPRFLSTLLQSLCFTPISVSDPPFYGTATLTIGWTLNYEIYFYALVAISLFFSKYRWFVFYALVAATLIIIPLSFGQFTFKPDSTTDFGIRYLNLITNPIIWNFVYGVTIGLIYTNPASFNRFSAIFSKPTVVIFVLTLVLWQYLSGFFGGFGPLQWGLGSAGLFTVFIFYTANHPVHFPVWLVRLGDISFSVYLLHIPVLVALRIFFHKIGYPGFITGTPMFILTISMTVVASHLSYECLELWLSQRMKSLFPHMNRSATEKQIKAGA